MDGFSFSEITCIWNALKWFLFVFCYIYIFLVQNLTTALWKSSHKKWEQTVPLLLSDFLPHANIYYMYVRVTIYIPMYVCRRSNAKGDVRYTSFPNQRLNAIINRHILDQKCTHTYAIGYALLQSSIISWIMISFKKAKCLQTASTINLCRSFHFLFFLT